MINQTFFTTYIHTCVFQAKFRACTPLALAPNGGWHPLKTPSWHVLDCGRRDSTGGELRVLRVREHPLSTQVRLLTTKSTPSKMKEKPSKHLFKPISNIFMVVWSSSLGKTAVMCRSVLNWVVTSWKSTPWRFHNFPPMRDSVLGLGGQRGRERSWLIGNDESDSVSVRKTCNRLIRFFLIQF